MYKTKIATTTTTTALVFIVCLLVACTIGFAEGLAKPPPSAEEVARVKREKANSFDDLFKGGVFAEEDPIPGAIQIASKIKSVKDLGWNGPEKRVGNTRPRHRAFGGEGEMPVQLKANYDEQNPACPEKWLTPEEFYKFAKASGPSADAVYVALAGGKKYAERNIVQSKLERWRSNGGRGFDETAFMKDVKDGQNDLIRGWTFFIGLNTLFISCIVLPTNPIAVALQTMLDSIING